MRIEVQKLLEELEELQKEGVYPNIVREAGEYLYDQVITADARHIIEVGAANGYSTIWLGLAAEVTGGHVITTEWGKDRFEVLKQNIERSGLKSYITAYNEDAKKVLANNTTPVDFLFIDAMAREYITYFRLLEPYFHNNSHIIADNTVSHKEKLQDFLDYVTMDARYDIKDLKLGKGMIHITIKK